MVQVLPVDYQPSQSREGHDSVNSHCKGTARALAILQRQLGVDILVTGHTHEFKVGLPTHARV